MARCVAGCVRQGGGQIGDNQRPTADPVHAIPAMRHGVIADVGLGAGIAVLHIRGRNRAMVHAIRPHEVGHGGEA